jgi:hypothetical protein
MGLAEVSSILWRERELLELLLFKLDEEQLVLTSGRTRWLARATKEVEMVLAEIRRAELARATEVDAAAAALGLAPNPSLTQLAEASPESWAGLLREHRAAFLALTAEINQLAEANRDLLTGGQQAAREALLAFHDAEPTYTPAGSTVTTAARARLWDEEL